MLRYRFIVFLCMATQFGSIAECSSNEPSPENTLDAAKLAIDRNDLPAFCECLTDEARDDFAGTCIYIVAYLKPGLALIGDEHKAKAVEKQLDELKKKYGFDETGDFYWATAPTANEDAQKVAMRKVLEGIGDLNDFIAEVDALGRQIDEEEKQKRLLTKDARLKDVEIEGDRAAAKLLETRDGKVTPESIEFRKVNGQWKISAMPGISE